MSLYGKMMSAAIGAVALSGTLLVPSSNSFASPMSQPVQPAAAEAPPAPVLAPEAPGVAGAAAAVEAPRPAPVVVEPVEAPEAPEPRRVSSTEMDDDLECLAKVVLHEAGNQSRTGQIAVAEVVMNRLADRRFPKTICGVILQRGQFFNVHAYHPQNRDRRWSRAVEIAREVRDGGADRVTNGALFFRAPHGAPFRGRTRTVTIGGHHFYR